MNTISRVFFESPLHQNLRTPKLPQGPPLPHSPGTSGVQFCTGSQAVLLAEPCPSSFFPLPFPSLFHHFELRDLSRPGKGGPPYAHSSIPPHIPLLIYNTVLVVWSGSSSLAEVSEGRPALAPTEQRSQEQHSQHSLEVSLKTSSSPGADSSHLHSRTRRVPGRHTQRWGASSNQCSNLGTLVARACGQQLAQNTTGAESP